jgi:3-dehydroquinate dehydratase-1
MLLRLKRKAPRFCGRFQFWAIELPMVNHTVTDKSSLLSQVLTVGSVADGETLDRLPEMHLASLCDVAEFRVDTWPELAARGAERAGECPVPVLVTVRRPDEGGLNQLSGADRRRLMEMFLPVATLADVEIASLGEMAGFVVQARSAGVPVVGSFHDFSGTPSLDDLRRKRDTALAAGADIVKFAANLHSSADIASLAALLEEPGHPPLSIMGMGALGRVSRLLFAKLGSVLNYGYLDRATVPGQWAARRLKELIGEL